MRFIALLRKELREILPWLLLAALLMLLIGGGLLRESVRHKRQFPLSDFGPLLLSLATGLGLVVAGRQFGVPGFLKTWAFTIHRSASWATILLAKLAAASIALVLAIAVLWTVMFFYAVKHELLVRSPGMRILAEGWIYISLGLIAYLAAALVGISTARWYTTRVFPLALALGIGFVALVQTGLAYPLLVIAAGAVLLGSQVVHAFLHREY